MKVITNVITQNGKNIIMIYMDGSNIESGEGCMVSGCMTDTFVTFSHA